MKGSIKYGSLTIVMVIRILVAPLVSDDVAQASIRYQGTTPGSINFLEAEKVRSSLLDVAAGRCSLNTGCLTSKEKVVSVPGSKRSDSLVLVSGTLLNEDLISFPSKKPYEADTENAGGDAHLVTTSRFQTLTHVISSHLAIVTRPVTAGKRLFFLVYDTFKDAIGWPALSVHARRSITKTSGSRTMDLCAWEERLDEMTGTETSYGTLDFLVDGEEFFPRFFEAVAGARRSVDIRTYIFDNDDFAIKVADTLKERSNELDIKVLMDGLGTIMATGVRPETLPLKYEPPESVRAYLTRESKVRVRQQVNPWFTGDHSKTVIVDNETAFVGGMNYGREYRYEWHDLMVQVDGQIVGDLARDFDKAWAGGGLLGDIESLFHSLKPGSKKSLTQGYPVRLLRTRPGDSEIRNTQLEAIRRSKAYVYIQNPYLTDDRVLNELVRASRRGVDVRVVLPARAEKEIINRSNALAANKMLQNGVRVFFLPRMSHVKAAVYDGWACFGSANYDKLSFRVNYEVNLATSHEPAVRELIDRLFIPDFEASLELTEQLPVKPQDYLLELVADQL